MTARSERRNPRESDAAVAGLVEDVARAVHCIADRPVVERARNSQLDHRAAAALSEFVGELRALGSFACSLPEALRFIRERVESLQVATDRPRPGSLYVCTFSQTGYSGRPHLFVVGLEEGRVFRRDRRCRTAGRRARRDFAGAPPIARQDRRSRLRRAGTARDLRSTVPSHVQLLRPRHPRIPRDLRIMADAARVSVAAAGRETLVSPDEGGTRRARLERARQSGLRVFAVRLVASHGRRCWPVWC